MSGFQLNLVESELKIILEALMEKERSMTEICGTSGNENEIADIGNDLIELRLLLNPLKDQAIQQYGEDILNFSQESFKS